MGTKSFDVSWTDFVHAYESAKIPPDDRILLQALESSRNNPPVEAKNYEDENVKLLLGVCYHLAKLNNGRFFLSSHKAGALIGIPQVTAFRILKSFCFDGVLEVGKLGNEYSANRYVWKGDPDKGVQNAL